MKLFVLSFAFIMLSIVASAQEDKTIGLSLQECVKMAIERNINMEKTRVELEKSGYKVSENRSALLPKVNINGSFTDYIEKSKTLLPGIIVGRAGENLVVEMGTQYNTNASINITQVLYNQSALTAVKIARQMETMSKLGVEKASEELTAEIAKLYFLTLTTARQQSLVEDNIDRIKRLSDIIQLLVENGMGRETDFERISVSLENLYTQHSNTKAVYEQQLNMIKYMLEIPIEKTVALTDSAEMTLLLHNPELTFDFANHIDIQTLEAQLKMNRLNGRLIKNAYLPTLAFAGQYGLTAYRDDFRNYFRNRAESSWFTSSYIGLSLSIPVFDGFEKRSKLRQNKMDYRKTSITLDNTKESFKVNYQNAINNYLNHKNNVERQKKNIALAEKVYRETAFKYREGMSTMSDVLQDELNLSNAQAAYLNAFYNFKEAEVNIMRLTGEIRNLIKG